MRPGTLHHQLNRRLAADLRDILGQPPYIRVHTIEPERDLLPVPRGVIEGVAEALEVADRKITSLENLTRALAQTLRGVLEQVPGQTTERAIGTLNEVDEALQ